MSLFDCILKQIIEILRFYTSDREENDAEALDRLKET
jgi:hypothetical protein